MAAGEPVLWSAIAITASVAINDPNPDADIGYDDVRKTLAMKKPA